MDRHDLEAVRRSDVEFANHMRRLRFGLVATVVAAAVVLGLYLAAVALAGA